MLILGYTSAPWHTSAKPRALEEILGARRLFCGGRNHGGDNTTNRTDGEEPLATRIATVGRKAHQALQVGERGPFDTVARNRIDLEIPAPRAMCVAGEGQRDASSIEPEITGMAAPRS